MLCLHVSLSVMMPQSDDESIETGLLCLIPVIDLCASGLECLGRHVYIETISHLNFRVRKSCRPKLTQATRAFYQFVCSLC